MNRLLSVVALTGLLASSASAAPNPFEGFEAQAIARFTAAGEAFAKDLGGLIGASDFHSARVPKLGGFDVGFRAAVQPDPSPENTLLTASGVDKIGLPFARVEAGLPLGFSVFARGIGAQGAKLIGGGARFQLYRSGLIPAIPDVAVTAGLDKLDHDVLDMTHVGASLQASFNIPIIKPFVGVGYDSTKVSVKRPAVIAGQEATGKGTRLTLGATLTPLPFTYIFGAYNMLHGETAGSLGLGIRFGGIL